MKDKNSLTLEEIQTIQLENQQLNAENQLLRQRVSGLMEAIDLTKARSAGDSPAIQQPDNWYRIPFIETKAILLIVDPEHKIIMDANPAACRFYGYTYVELVGKGISEINTATPESIESILKQAVTGNYQLYVFNHRLADGTIRQVEVNSSPITINSKVYLFSIIHDITDRITAENSLRESEARFKLLVEASVDGIVLMDAEGKLLLTNPSFDRIMNYQPGQISHGKHLCKIFQPGQAGLIQDFIRGTKQHPVSILKDVNILRPDGSEFEADIQAVLMPGVNGGPDQIVAYLRDITVERRHQRMIQQNEEHLRMISEVTSDEVFALCKDADGEITHEWNTGALTIMGERAQAMDPDRGWEKYLTDESRQKLRKIIENQFIHPCIQKTEAVLIPPDGTERIVQVLTRTIVDPSSGSVVKVIGAVKDTTDQTHAERSLVASENLFRSIFERGPTGMVTVSLAGNFLKVNDAFCKMVGYSEAELLRMGVYELTAPAFLEQTRELYQNIGSKTDGFALQEKQYTHKDGKLIWVQIQASLVKNEKNQPDYVIIMVTNVTEQKEAIEKLRQNEELIANTIANVNVVLFVINNDGKFLLSEGRGLALLNLHPGQIVGQSVYDVYAGHTVILNAVKSAFQGEFAHPKVILGEAIFDTYFSPYTDRNGKIQGIVGIATDITEKEHALDQLRESEEKYTSIFETCPIPLSVSNFRTGELVEINQEFLDEFGFTREEAIGKTAISLGIFVNPEDRSIILDKIEKDGQIAHFELPTKAKNGDRKVELFAARKVVYGNKEYLLSVSSNIDSQKQNEFEIFNSRQILQSILDHIPQRVFWKDLENHYLGANRQYLMDAGVTNVDQILGKTDEELYDSQYAQRFIKSDRIVIENDAPYLNYEERQPVIGDKEIWVRTNKIPLHDQNGKVTTVLGTYEDMTDIRDAQNKLIDSEERFRNLAIHAPVGIYEKNAELVTVFVNQRLTDMVGFSAFESEKEDWMLGIFPEDLSTVRSEWEATILKGKDYYGEYRRVKPDGTVLWVADHEKIIRDRNGKIVGYLGTLTDITQIKQAESEIKQSLSLQTATLDSTADGILAIDLEGKITSYNQKFVDLWNISPDQLSKLNYSSLAKKLKAELVTSDSITQLVVNKRMDQAETSFEVLFLNDQRVFEEFSLPQVLDEEIVGRVWSYRDVTARFRSEEKLRLTNTEMEAMIKRLSALRNIDMAITGHTAFYEVVKDILPNVAESTNADAVALLLPHPDGKHLYVVGQQGLVLKDKPQNDVINLLIDIKGKYAGKAFRSRQSIWVEDMTSDLVDGIRIYEDIYAGYAAVPLISKNEVKGVLEIFTKAPATGGYEVREFLHSLAMQVAIAIDNADLFSRMERTNLDLLAAYEATIEGWARALELRDKETLGHSERVVQKTIQLAGKLGITDDDLIQVRRGVFLHDIGKMAVPDMILLKPGPLTDEEWIIMKMHPSYAYEMLVGIPYLRRALDIPYCHHEKWDGNGYPRGLKAEQIPLPARVFSVVDVWDALTSKRPYRPAWPEPQVRTYLREQAGKQFDPRIVEMFLEMLDEDR